MSDVLCHIFTSGLQFWVFIHSSNLACMSLSMYFFNYVTLRKLPRISEKSRVRDCSDRRNRQFTTDVESMTPWCFIFKLVSFSNVIIENYWLSCMSISYFDEVINFVFTYFHFISIHYLMPSFQRSATPTINCSPV